MQVNNFNARAAAELKLGSGKAANREIDEKGDEQTVKPQTQYGSLKELESNGCFGDFCLEVRFDGYGGMIYTLHCLDAAGNVWSKGISAEEFNTLKGHNGSVFL